MDKEFLRDTFLGMLQIMRADLDKLSSIADASAKEEAMRIIHSGRGNYTTSPIGRNLSYAGEVHSNLTVPLAMTCFSIMDLLGKILCCSASHQGESKDVGNFIKHSRAFEKMAGRDYLKKDRSAAILQDAFRHSIAHGFLPGATSKIAYHVSYDYELQSEPLILVESSNYILNVKCLSLLAKEGLDRLISIVQTGDSVLELNEILALFDRVLKETDGKLKHLDS